MSLILAARRSSGCHSAVFGPSWEAAVQGNKSLSLLRQACKGARRSTSKWQPSKRPGRLGMESVGGKEVCVGCRAAKDPSFAQIDPDSSAGLGNTSDEPFGPT
eukprot:scaffold70877_cov36-Prasinocladus_malaysianus.AAC.1